MDASLRLPEVLAHRLEKLAEEEGTSVDRLIRRLMSEHLERRPSAPLNRKAVRFPLIPKHETGVVSPVTGAELDEIFAR